MVLTLVLSLLVCRLMRFLNKKLANMQIHQVMHSSKKKLWLEMLWIRSVQQIRVHKPRILCMSTGRTQAHQPQIGRLCADRNQLRVPCPTALPRLIRS
jgi:hypothetical protein